MSNNKEPKMDKAAFWKRARKLFDEWKAKSWGGSATPADAVMLLRGKPDEDVIYSRAGSLQHWLFGYELFSTCVVFGAGGEMLVAATPAKIKVLRQLGEADEEAGLRLAAVEVPRGGPYDEAAARVAAFVKAAGKGAVCGYLKKEPVTGAFAEAVTAAVKAGAELADVSANVAVLLHVKSSREIKHTRAAAEFASAVLRRHLLPQVEDVIDKESKVTHSALSDRCEGVFDKPERVKSKLSAGSLDVAYSPVVQSGGKFDLRPSAQPDDRPLAHRGVIMLSVGARYREYCANIVRTYFVDPAGQQQAYYRVLQSAFVACRKALRPGRPLRDAYLAAAEAVKASPHPELGEHLTKNCGFGTGLEFRDGTLLITAKTKRTVSAGMVFNIAVGFDGLPHGSADDDGGDEQQRYAMMIADTAVVVEDDDDGAELLTHAKREWKEVYYQLDDGGDSEEGEDGEGGGDDDGDDGDAAAAGGGSSSAAAGEAAAPVTRRSRALAARESTMKENLEKEKRAKEKRKLLELKKQEELKRRLEKKGDSAAAEEAPEDAPPDSYRSPLDFPSKARKSRIMVDEANETVLMPINGRMVPFHISTIKSVTLSDAHPYKSIRFNFLTPDIPFSQKMKLPPGAEEGRVYVQEVSYRSRSKNFDQVHFDVNQLRKQVANLKREREETLTLVEQPSLKLCARGTRIPRLSDVSVLPSVARGRVTGVVEAHLNGIRFTSRKHGVKLDVVYQNIKHAFYQVARKDTMSVMLHFQLRNEIMVNKKKTSFVQFYFDVVEASQDLDSRARHGDEDGLVEEQEERRLRSTWNKRFKDFAREVEEMSARHNSERHHVEFDKPYTELKFEGVAGKEVATLLPTVHCLVSLDDSPPLCVTLDDVELVSFERVQFQLRNFDVAFVFKDFDRAPLVVTAVPMKYLETVKDWLDSINVLHYESRVNLMWKKILATIAEDPADFYDNGGWAFLNAEGGGGDDSDEDDSDDDDESEFEPDDDDEASESSEEYESSESESESESDSADSEVSGEDWDELERQAERDDRRKRDREVERDGGGDYQSEKKRRR